MPCLGPDTREEDYARFNREINFLSRALCATLTFLESKGESATKEYLRWLLKKENCEEHAVTADEIVDWWENHKAQDRERRKRQAAEDEEKRIRSEALSKLSNKERAALGLPLRTKKKVRQ
jgi:hypothetical protein